MKYIFIIAAALLYCSSPVFAQQRIIVEKATGNVVDAGDSTLQYDDRYYDNLDYPGRPIPDGVDFRKYARDAKGDIVLRPANELKGFDDEWRSDLISRVTASRLSADVKEILLEIITNMRR
ncbi:MAG: hypothetical protein ACREQ7_07645 [Candidatus Binatia bacterium]